MRHGRGIAVRIVGIGFRHGITAADSRSTQAVAGLDRVDPALLVIGIAARPVAVGGMVDQLQEIADRVVEILLGVAAHRLPIAGLRQAHAERIVPGGLRLRRLADMLTPAGVDQAIHCIIGIGEVLNQP